MKKNLLGMAAIALIFVSCSKDQTTSVNKNNPDVIGFETSTGKTTKATTNTVAAIQADMNGFGVYATNGAAQVEFIANMGYKWNSTETSWQWDGTPQMWPKVDVGYPVNFYAYYPKSGTALNVADLTKQYAVNADVSNQIDMLAANQLNVVARPASSNVALDFKHIFSKINFKVLTGANVTAEVQSIVVKNVFSTRTFDYATLAWLAAPAAETNASYAYLSAPAVAANKFAGATTAAAVTNTTGSLMLMPQDLLERAWPVTAAPTATQSYIEVTYRVFETISGKDITGYTDATKHPQYTILGSTVTGNLFVKVGFALPTVWDMGKAYTYTIYLGHPDAAGGNLVDNSFIDESGDATDLPVVDSGTGEVKNIPEPIVDTSKPIGFIVSVSAWEDAAGIPLQ